VYSDVFILLFIYCVQHIKGLLDTKEHKSYMKPHISDGVKSKLHKTLHFQVKCDVRC
jgi:hypothetical protein